MKLSEFKSTLRGVSALNFIQLNGNVVPEYFHITEAGLTTKNFIDCGGKIRVEKAINFQVWIGNDQDHRLEPYKLIGIIETAENLFGTEDLDVEIEYQTETIGRYGLEFNGEDFQLTAKQTDCLAKESCGVPKEKKKLQLVELTSSEASCCTPGGGCC